VSFFFWSLCKILPITLGWYFAICRQPTIKSFGNGSQCSQFCAHACALYGVSETLCPNLGQIRMGDQCTTELRSSDHLDLARFERERVAMIAVGISRCFCENVTASCRLKQ